MTDTTDRSYNPKPAEAERPDKPTLALPPKDGPERSSVHQAVEKFQKIYLGKQIEAGNFACFAELTGNLLLMNRHEGRRDAYEEIAADLTALLEGFV